MAGIGGKPSGESRCVDNRLEVPRGSLAFAEDLGCLLSAAAAATGHTQRTLQLPDVANAGCRSPANLRIGDPVTDADVHGLVVLPLLPVI